MNAPVNPPAAVQIPPLSETKAIAEDNTSDPTLGSATSPTPTNNPVAPSERLPIKSPFLSHVAVPVLHHERWQEAWDVGNSHPIRHPVGKVARSRSLRERGDQRLVRLIRDYKTF